MKHRFQNKQLTDDKADAEWLACRSKKENSKIKLAKARVAVGMLKYVSEEGV
ncbi:MAG: hypothetical protein K2G18_00060 [Bacteroidales bacterium]|nr:hypothetical protein [Bacteroidales bacterium]